MAITRDPWFDAYRIATRVELDRELVAVRRKLWIRRASSLALCCALLLGVLWSIDFVLDPDADDLWNLGLKTLFATFALMGLGLVLIIAGAVRTAGAARPFVRSDAFLSRADRAWLRRQVVEGRPVPDGRRLVVADVARTMVVEGRFVPTYLGFAVMYLGMILGGMKLGSFLIFIALVLWMMTRAVGGLVWSRRARRWLALNP